MADADVMARLEKLERDNRRMKRGGIAFLVLLVALSALYATRPVPQKITAREFDVVDGTGKVRIRMWVQNDGMANVGVFDTTGRIQAQVSWANFVGPQIDLGFHKPSPSPLTKGLPRGAVIPDVSIGDYPPGAPGITLRSGGIERGNFSLFPEGSPQLGFFNEGGRETVRLMNVGNVSTLEFLGSQNQNIGGLSFPVDRMQLSSFGLDFDDKDGTSAISLADTNPGRTDTSLPLRHLWFFDAKGNARASIQISPTGAPNFELNDRQGYTMDLGVTGTVTPLTGQTQQTSADSIIMFGNDKKHHVIWQAPQ